MPPTSIYFFSKKGTKSELGLPVAMLSQYPPLAIYEMILKKNVFIVAANAIIFQAKTAIARAVEIFKT